MLIYICVTFSEQKEILAASVQNRNKVILFKKHGVVNVSMEFLVSKALATAISDPNYKKKRRRGKYNLDQHVSRCDIEQSK